VLLNMRNECQRTARQPDRFMVGLAVLGLHRGGASAPA
jgi:hypothetical protein